MSVYKRKGSPFYVYDFTIDGVRFRGSTQTAERESAKSIVAKLRADAVKNKHFRQKPGITVNEAFGRYTIEVGQHAASADDIAYQLENLQRGLGKDRTLAAIEDGDIAEYVAKRRGMRPANAKKGSDRLISSSTVNREIELLRRVFIRARDTWKVDIGDMPDWKKLLLPEAEGRTRFADQTEIARLMTAVRKLRPEFEAPIRFSIESGVRQQNALWLKWSEVNFNSGLITIRTKSKRPGKEEHKVKITPAIKVLIANESGNHPVYVFTYAVKKKRGARLEGLRMPFTRSGWRKQWEAILTEAKLRDFRWHDLRHTAGTWFQNTKKDIKLTQQFMGHKDIQSTMRYVHSAEDIGKAMDEMSRRIFAAEKAAEDPKQLEEKKKSAV